MIVWTSSESDADADDRYRQRIVPQLFVLLSGILPCIPLFGVVTNRQCSPSPYASRQCPHHLTHHHHRHHRDTDLCLLTLADVRYERQSDILFLIAF
uniref:Frizzled/Smoothened transmembrane domain-containing protein n=1 Tax=Angiostrongylus cantonensis TaxID=6313 RepID=A0A0K0CT21_ANGCA